MIGTLLTAVNLAATASKLGSLITVVRIDLRFPFTSQQKGLLC
jgi:hypothetical protein